MQPSRRIPFVFVVVSSLLIPAAAALGQSRFLDRSAAEWSEQLISREAKDRRAAAFALGKIGPSAESAVPRLVKALNDSDASVADAAAFALGEIGPRADRAVGPLLDALADPSKDARVRRSAACALAGIRSPKDATTGLIKALDDKDAGVRQNAAWALGRLKPTGARPAVEALAGKLADSDAAVRRDAAGALQDFGPDAKPALDALVDRAGVEADPLVRKAVLTTLTNLVGPEDRAAAKALVPLLEDRDPETAHAAAFALGNIGGSQAAPAVPLLREALRDRDPSVRRLASAALANIGPDAVDAVADLAQALTDADPTVKTNAALALGRVGRKAEPAIPQLAKALNGKEPVKLRVFAAQALADIAKPMPGDVAYSAILDPALPELLRTLKEDRDPQVRQRVVWALGRVRDFEDSGAAAALTDLLSEKAPEMTAARYSAAQHLAYRLRTKAPDKAIDVLVEMLNDKTLKIYDGASTKVSGGTETTGGSSTVTEKLGGDGRRLPADALGQIGKKANRPDVIRSLEEVSKAEDKDVQEAARDALRRIKD